MQGFNEMTGRTDYGVSIWGTVLRFNLPDRFLPVFAPARKRNGLSIWEFRDKTRPFDIRRVTPLLHSRQEIVPVLSRRKRFVPPGSFFSLDRRHRTDKVPALKRIGVELLGRIPPGIANEFVSRIHKVTPCRVKLVYPPGSGIRLNKTVRVPENHILPHSNVQTRVPGLTCPAMLDLDKFRLLKRRRHVPEFLIYAVKDADHLKVL